MTVKVGINGLKGGEILLCALFNTRGGCCRGKQYT